MYLRSTVQGQPSTVQLSSRGGRRLLTPWSKGRLAGVSVDGALAACAVEHATLRQIGAQCRKDATQGFVRPLSRAPSCLPLILLSLRQSRSSIYQYESWSASRTALPCGF